MTFRAMVGLLALTVFAAGSVALGAEDPGGEKPGSWLALILLLAPLAVMVWIVLFLRRSAAKQRVVMDTSLAHITRMEQKTDRMIELLESIDRKLGQGNYWESADARPSGE